jgi:sulfur-oxidizing protein SoxY
MTRTINRPFEITRRTLFVGAGSLALAPLAASVRASPDEMSTAMGEVLAGATAKPGRVKLEIPELAENGFSVPLTITVESPMTAADHVKSIYIFSEKNPLPNVVRFHLGPRAGRAKVSTSIRLADTQRITALARMSDGSFWSADAEVIVTIAACLEGG